MISFNHLGNLGRLGNQMFQYASSKQIIELKKGFGGECVNKDIKDLYLNG